MSRTSREDAVARIRKLLAMARDGSATEGEVENAMRAARTLMDRYAIQDDELAGGDPSRMDGIVDEPGDWHSHEPTDRDRLLAVACGHLCDVGVGMKSKYFGRTLLYCTTFWGLPRDVAVAHAVFPELRSTMHRMARFRYGQRWSDQHTSYCCGFSLRLAVRAEELATASAQPAAAAGAIIVRKRALLDAWAQQQGVGKARPAKSRRDIDGCAFTLGMRDGDDVALDTRGIGAAGDGAQRANLPAREGSAA